MYVIDGGIADLYLLKGEDGFVLVDAGMPAEREHILKAFAEQGVTPDNLKLVFITHTHDDHSGNGRFFQSEYGAKIAVHELEKGRAVTADRTFPLAHTLRDKVKRLLTVGQNAKIEIDPFLPDVLFSGGESLKEYGLDALVVHLPGHSAGSMGIIFENTLYSGDVIASADNPLPTYGDDVLNMRETIKNIAKMEDVHTVATAHAGVYRRSDIDLSDI